MTDPGEPSGKRGIFAELQRRNVLRAAAIYVAAAWALAQGIAQLAPSFNAPGWITRWFVIACVIGFPFWIMFSWFFEFTPGRGMRREGETHVSDATRRHTGRKLDFAIIGILAIAVVLLVTNTFVLHRDVNSTAAAADAKAVAAALAKVPFKSVAVLPLANDSGDPKQQYFSDGLSEELISDLTQITGLKVIGRDSSFKFRNSKESPAQIGAALGVAHLIVGSVRQQGNRIRVTLSMISAKDGASVWSHSYDEKLKDVFAIQSRIGDAVASALKIKLLGKAIVASDKPPSGNARAYELMLQGRTIYRHGTEDAIHQGMALFRQALKLDPKYAYVWGLLSNASVNLGVLYLTGDAREKAYAQARAAVDKERLLAPNAAFTHNDAGYVLANVANDPTGALAEYQRALALAPNDITSMNHVAGGLLSFGRLQQAATIYRKLEANDPFRAEIYYSMAVTQLALRNLDAADRANRKALGLRPDFPGLHENQVEIEALRGNAEAARSSAEKVTDPVLGPWARVLARQIGHDHQQADVALRNYIAKHGKDQPYLVADLYALRKQPDKMFEWLQRAWTQHDPMLISNILFDPFVLAYQHDPRFAALCQQAGLPVPGQSLTATVSPKGH